MHTLNCANGLTSRVVQTEAEWDAMRPDWEALYAASPTASPPLDFAWLRNWWDVYGHVYGAGGLRIISVWRGSQLLGVLPLYMSGRADNPLAVRCLRFISTGEAE